MPAFTVQLYYTRIPGLLIQIHVFVKASGLLQIHHYAYMSRGFEKFVGYDLGRHLEYVKCSVIASLGSQG